MRQGIDSLADCEMNLNLPPTCSAFSLSYNIKTSLSGAIAFPNSSPITSKSQHDYPSRPDYQRPYQHRQSYN
jgi:hypothetical protein